METAFWTVLSGTLVIALGKMIDSLCIQPFISYKKVIGEVTFQLVFYAQAYSSRSVKESLHQEASKIFRKSASRLQTYYNQVEFMHYFGIVPTRKDIDKATSSLIGLSNATPPRDDDNTYNDKRVRIVREKLRIGSNVDV